MKLTKVVILGDDNGYGLSTIELSRLGNVVILAGKNGSGKTRVLKAVQNAASMSPDAQAYEKLLRNEIELTRRIKLISESLETSKTRGDDERTLQTLQRQLGDAEGGLANTKRTLARYHAIQTDSADRNEIRCVEFLPKRTFLEDDRTIPDRERDARALRLTQFGPDNLNQGTIALVREVQTAYFEATHPESSMDAELRALAKKNYGRLDDLIDQFLGVRLGRNSKGLPTLFGNHPSDAHLSDGQIILLQLCAQLYAQSSNLRDVVLFLDEPENHLHPAACIDMIDDLRKHEPRR